MKFNQYLTEAVGRVWVFWLDTESGRATGDDVMSGIEIFTSEAKVVERMLDIMPEIEDEELLTNAELKKITKISQVYALIKKHDELRMYDDVFYAKEVKVDA